MSTHTAAENAERVEAILSEQSNLTATYGSDRATWPTGQAERYDRLQTGLNRLLLAEQDSAAAQRTEQTRSTLRSGAYETESGFGVIAREDLPGRVSDPWRDMDEGIIRTESPRGLVARAHTVLEVAGGLVPQARTVLADAIDTDRSGLAAAAIVARSNPDYRSAFEKIIRNPERGQWTLTPAEAAAMSAVEILRSTLETDTGTGGYSIPLALDPTLAALTNNGVADPFRSVCTVKTAISSPARALKSAGMTASWLAEGSAASDASPSIGNVDVPLFKLTAWATASYELLADSGADLGALITEMVADARERAEGAAFATGDGSSAPKGLITAVAANSGSTVTATTRGSFTTASSVDVFAVLNALTPRARKARSASCSPTTPPTRPSAR